MKLFSLPILTLIGTLMTGCSDQPPESNLNEVENPPVRGDQLHRIHQVTSEAAGALSAALRAMDPHGNYVVSQQLVNHTQCIISMRVTRGAFLLGGQGGEGLMACRLPYGAWSAPSYVRTGGFNLSAAIGFDVVDVTMFITDPGLAESYKSQGTFSTSSYASAVAGSASIALNAASQYGMAVVQTNQRGLFAGVGISFTSMSHMQARRNQHVYQDILGGGAPTDLNGRPCSDYLLPVRRNHCITDYQRRTGMVPREVTSFEILRMSADNAPMVTRPFNDVLRGI